MDLEELRTVLRTERERDGLQHLRESFYRDVAAHLADLKARRKQAAEQADDPFSDPEVRRLTDRIETAEDVVESLYERRVGKVVKRASFAAAGMSHDDEGLTDEERDLFDDLVARIERNRTRVLDSLDPDAGASAPAGDPPTGETSPDTTSGPMPAESTAAPPTDADTPDPNDLLSEAMGGTDDATGEDESEAGAPTADGGERAAPGPDSAAPVPTPGGGSSPDDAAADADDGPDGGDPGRTTVYVTRDVGEIYGVDERTYRLEAEDVVALPADNARALVERGAAEPLE